VSTSATKARAAGAPDNTLQENEGDAPILNKNKANVIFLFSVGKYLAERFHSASCGTIANCFAHPANCTPTDTQNKFGCDTRGTLVLNPITEANGTVSNPTTPFPPVKTSTINPGFDLVFTRVLYEVVNQPAGDGSIPAYLAPYFGPTGFTCTNSTAKKDLRNYGFFVLPNGTGPGDCGSSQKG
jgi:hypothetical protein